MRAGNEMKKEKKENSSSSSSFFVTRFTLPPKVEKYSDVYLAKKMEKRPIEKDL
jgi:hypothetical protein